MKTFTINPSTNMMDVLGFSGYTFNSAIADIIDNSISAHAKNIKVLFEIVDEKINVYILDDGDGMNLDKLHKCMIPAYKDLDEVRSDDDLGRYSLGLKSASKSFCKQLFVSSKISNGNVNTVEIDFEYIKKYNKWEAFELDSFEHQDMVEKHGTLVFWNDVTFKSITKKVDEQYVYDTFEKLEISLSHVFGKYILEDGINIYIQSLKSKNKEMRKIEGWNPFCLPHNKNTNRISVKQIKMGNHTIETKSYILPTYSNLDQVDQLYMEGNGLIEQSGFYIYRNKRLIQEGGWLDLPYMTADQKCEYARIEVNIGTFLDKEFDVNFSKCKISVPQDLISAFVEIAKFARTSSRKNYNYVKNPETKPTIKKKNDIKVWQTYSTPEGMKIRINLEHPIIDEIFKKLNDSEKKKLTTLLTNTLPIGMLQSQGGFEEKYSELDIKELIKTTYLEMYSKIKDIKQVKKEMFKTEPFNLYTNEVVDFFNSLEVEEDD